MKKQLLTLALCLFSISFVQTNDWSDAVVAFGGIDNIVKESMKWNKAAKIVKGLKNTKAASTIGAYVQKGCPASIIGKKFPGADRSFNPSSLRKLMDSNSPVKTPPAKPKTATPPAKPKTATPPAKPKTATPPAKPKTATPPAKPKTATPPAKPKTATPPANGNQAHRIAQLEQDLRDANSALATAQQEASDAQSALVTARNAQEAAERSAQAVDQALSNAGYASVQAALTAAAQGAYAQNLQGQLSGSASENQLALLNAAFIQIGKAASAANGALNDYLETACPLLMDDDGNLFAGASLQEYIDGISAAVEDNTVAKNLAKVVNPPSYHARVLGRLNSKKAITRKKRARRAHRSKVRRSRRRARRFA